MDKIFTVKEFTDRLRHLNTIPNIYYSGGNGWSSWNGSAWQFDCVVSIKSILWGWHEDKNAPHGGAILGSNGVPDFTTDGGLDYCYDVSDDFSTLQPGEYVCMAGTGISHAGVSFWDENEQKVRIFEVTTSWGVNGTTLSDVNSEGVRSRYGQDNLRWTYHGKLEWIDYDEPEPTSLKYKVGDVVEINGVYVSSESTEKLTPAITKGTITRIVEGARNPYLLDDGNIGWVNDECIVEPEPPTPIDYEKLYNEELEKNKLLEIEIATLKEKIDKAIEVLS